MSDSLNEQAKPLITINIYGVNRKICSDCGPSTPEVELAEAARLGLAQRYGDRVAVHYHDLRDAATAERNRALVEKARDQGAPLPLVVMDGRIVQGGGIEFRCILNAVDLKLEQEGR